MNNKLETPDWREWQTFILRHGLELGLSITENQTSQLALHAAELARWNKRINLTAITEPTETAVKHFLDALVPSLYIPENSKLLDVGTGGGFPGLPLKVMLPSLSVTLVDATLKKINFVQQIIRMLGLDNATAFHGRVELLENEPGFSRAFDTVVCRAFDSLSAFVASTHRLIRENGCLIAMKGRQTADELSELDSLELSVNNKPVKVTDLFTIDIHHYNLPVLGDERSLIILTATTQVP